MAILGALLSFPAHLGDFPVLDAGSENLSVVDCCDLKEQLLAGLLHSAKKEPAGLARSESFPHHENYRSFSFTDECVCCRCIALSGLGIYLYEDILMHGGDSPWVDESVQVLLSTLRVSSYEVYRYFLCFQRNIR